MRAIASDSRRSLCGLSSSVLVGSSSSAVPRRPAEFVSPGEMQRKAEWVEDAPGERVARACRSRSSTAVEASADLLANLARGLRKPRRSTPTGRGIP